MAHNGKLRCLVIGGSGFVGKHLVRQLLETQRYIVTIFDIKDAGIVGVKTVVGDLRSLEQVKKAVEGQDLVFHCAAITPTKENDSNKKLMWDVNVVGTENVVKACFKYNVPKLIYTSSSSVVFEGKDLLNVDETKPYAPHPLEYYSETKIAGEKMVLAANGHNNLTTVALRPASVFGEEDPLFFPTLVENAKKGKTKYMIGAGENLTDFTYVGNIAAANIKAAEALSPTSQVAGQAYFITNDEPKYFWDFTGDVLEGLGYPRPHIKLPFLLIYIIALLLQYVVKPLMAVFGRSLTTDLSPLKVLLVSSNRTFSCKKAKDDFGYKPPVNMEKALNRTLESFSYLKNAKNLK